MQEFSAPTLRIHGDNMIECERALRVIARALALKISFVARPIYFPRYALGENSQAFPEILITSYRVYIILDSIK